MIIWLASFPRSGNTLTRMFCWRVFGIDSSTVYLPVGADSNRLYKLEGFKTFSNWRELSNAWENFPEPHLVKTHKLRENQQKAIIVVRDVRGCMLSYWHYHLDIQKGSLSMEDFIVQESHGWTKFLDSWDALKPSQKIFIRYGEILTCPEKVAVRLADFLKIKPKNIWKNNFAECKKIFPEFFRLGRVGSWHEELPSELENFLIVQNRKWLEKLGYL